MKLILCGTIVTIVLLEVFGHVKVEALKIKKELRNKAPSENDAPPSPASPASTGTIVEVDWSKFNKTGNVIQIPSSYLSINGTPYDPSNNGAKGDVKAPIFFPFGLLFPSKPPFEFNIGFHANNSYSLGGTQGNFAHSITHSGSSGGNPVTPAPSGWTDPGWGWAPEPTSAPSSGWSNPGWGWAPEPTSAPSSGWSSNTTPGWGWQPPSTTAGWAPPPTTAGWTAPSTTAGWTAPPTTTAGWAPPPTTAGWTAPAPTTPGWSPPPTTEGWTAPAPTTTTTGWTTPPPTTTTTGWTTTTTPPPTTTTGWTTPPPTTTTGWTTTTTTTPPPTTTTTTTVAPPTEGWSPDEAPPPPGWSSLVQPVLNLPEPIPEGLNSPPQPVPEGLNSPPQSVPEGLNSPPQSVPEGLNSPPQSVPEGLILPPQPASGGYNFHPQPENVVGEWSLPVQHHVPAGEWNNNNPPQQAASGWNQPPQAIPIPAYSIPPPQIISDYGPQHSQNSPMSTWNAPPSDPENWSHIPPQHANRPVTAYAPVPPSAQGNPVNAVNQPRPPTPVQEQELTQPSQSPYYSESGWDSTTTTPSPTPGWVSTSTQSPGGWTQNQNFGLGFSPGNRPSSSWSQGPALSNSPGRKPSIGGALNHPSLSSGSSQFLGGRN